ncbi:lysylphosphatidylglycerol synthase transmembrane domain-containing protein [Prosthecobacter sp. SYSU 5D2]|uniref:lysylphosphatidylglycerol synthase transmembrane domain-containing protein n=1 Tax=Prosthecobacter sp. SYSU 5D2 TaxID=3134134 RepID=UPI0031FEEF94
MKKALLILLKIGITTVLLWMIFREHRFTVAILPHLKAMLTHWDWTLAGLALVGLSCWFHSLRWQVLLIGQQHPVPAATVLRLTFVSNFFNITSLGAVGGDAYKAIALLKRPGARKLPIMVSIMLDHMLGIYGLAILFLGFGWAFRDRLESYGPEVHAIVKGFTWFLGGSIFGITLSAISFTPRLYGWGERQFPKLLGFPPLKDFAQACDAIRRSWGCSLLAILLSALIFAAHFLSFYCAIFAVGGQAPLWEVMAAMPIVDTAAGLPLSVSGLGVREKTFETLIHAMTGLPEATAVSASLAGWLMMVVWGLFGGLLFICGTHPAESPTPSPPSDA